MRYLGIDYGNKRIGIAISDQSNIIANPLLTIINKNDESVLNELNKIIKEYDISDIIIGMPFSFNFTNTEQTDITQSFIDFLNLKLPNMPVHLENEILSTKEAENRLDNMDNKNNVIDQTSACLLLQSFLDKQ